MDGITKVIIRIKGVAPILMHNGTLADPTNHWVKRMKEITSKHHSKVTDSDREKLVELEFNGGLYFDDDIGPFIPSTCIEGAIRDAARGNRKGKQVESGLIVEQAAVPLEYSGPDTREGLFNNKAFVDTRPVKLQKSSTVMRTRPRFNEWALEFELMIIDEVLSIDDVHKFIESAGLIKGICDYRPKFGRFVVDEFIEV